MREVKHSCDEKSMRYTIIDVSMLRKILYLLSAKIIRNHKHSLTVMLISVHYIFRLLFSFNNTS